MTEARPGRDGLLLKNEAGLSRKNPSWQLVETVVREIDDGHGNSFCVLEASNGHYIQTLRGFNGYHLEWRMFTTAEEKGYVHYRACYPGASPKFMELKKHDFTDPGEHRDLLLLDDVVDGFRSFYSGNSMPAWLEWRSLAI
jgi:hypothetical protein